MSNPKQLTPIAEQLATWSGALAVEQIPGDVSACLRRSLVDAAGLMVASRGTPYTQACVATSEQTGQATAIGHADGFSLQDAALISGTAAHGEDFDDTFEGTPVHVGAVLVPAVLAAGEANDASGADILRGLAVGGEISCRLAVVAPTAIHRAGFHPTAVIGAIGAAAAVATTLRLSPAKFASALGIAGSMASGIIEYLAEGTSTKRLHPGWAAQSGIRAARLASAGFDGPRTVIEGQHGFFKAFAAPSIEADFSKMTNQLGSDWLVSGLAFKPYACGTMVQPFIDCAIKLRREGIEPDAVESIVAEVGEGTVHRLWEPLAEKRRPTTPYSAKFSVPYGIAIGLVDGAAGLNQFTTERISDDRVLGVAKCVSYEIDPANEYPANYSGALRVVLKNGQTTRVEQAHLRGGKHEPLSSDEITDKFRANTSFGGWSSERAAAFLKFSETIFAADNLSGLKDFRA